MICPVCATGNRDGATFCRHCGRLLHNACPRCAAAAEPDANFCDTCGYPLSPQAWFQMTNDDLRLTNDEAIDPRPPKAPSRPVSQTPSLAVSQSPHLPTTSSSLLDRFIPRQLLDKMTAAQGAEAERRVVTLLFCDIQGSTALAGQLDPEEWTEIVNGAFEQIVRPIYQYEGTVARLMGDGLLAFFGAPIAHEDDPRRAVLAGLAIVEGIHAYRATLPPAAADLDVRVGINTGLVVVGAVGSDLRLEYSAIGDAINLAARMEQTADPGTVRIAEDTYRLIEGGFEVEPLGGIVVKGKEQPVAAYRVLCRAGGPARRAGSLRSALVNRRMAWEQLEEAFNALDAGRGGILFLTGDAGMGKTRLIEEATERLLPALNPAAAFYGASAASYETSRPYGLLVRLLRPPLGLMTGDGPEQIHRRIAAAVADEDDAQLLKTLFGVAGGHESGGEGFAGRLDECLGRFWLDRAADGPLVLALDELQWIDASSADRLAHLFRLAETRPALFLCALRRERHTPGWRLKETAGRELPHRLVEQALYPLNDGESRALLAGLLGAADLPDLPAELILDKAEGNPLFLEEVVRHLIDQGDLTRGDDGGWSFTPSAADIRLPDSIQALVTARVDRLDDDTRRVLQVASVIGRHFLRSPLAALVDEPDALDRQLLDLQRMEFIREVSRLPEPGYQFDHALTQEAVYNTILLKQRRAMHLRTAEVIESIRADNLTAVAPVLAHHFIEGDAGPRALPYLMMAGAAALRLHATAEAIAHCERALPIALALPDGSRALVDITTHHGRALELESRYAEAQAFYEMMQRLAQERGDQALELAADIGLGKLYGNVTPLYDAARGRALMEQALELAKATGDRVAETRVLWNLVNIDRFDLNSLDKAIVNGERGVALARELGLDEELAYLLNDVGDIYSTAGQFARGIAYLDEAGELWTALGNEPMLADSLSSGAIWRSIFGDLSAALELTARSIRITSRLGNPWGEAYGRGVRGEVLSLMGEFGESLVELHRAMELARKAGFIGGQVLDMCFLSRAYLQLGDVDAAIEAAREGLAIGRAQLPQFAGMACGQLAAALVAAGRLDEAAETLADPLARQEQQQVFVNFELSMAHIDLALAQGRGDDALRHARTAVDSFAGPDSLGWMPVARLAEGQALARLGRLDEAAVSLAQATAAASANSMRGWLWNILAASAAVEEARGNHEAAADLLAQAAAEIDHLLPRIYPDPLRNAFLAQPAVRALLTTTTS